MAYQLMLFAKLCHDYQQRHGWYVAFHEIAYDRLNKLQETWPAADGVQLSRWIQIARDSHAAACFGERKQEGLHLLEESVRRHKQRREPYIRAAAHLISARIILLLERPTKSSLRAAQLQLERFDKLTELARRVGNTRAWHVRSAQYLRLARLVLMAVDEAQVPRSARLRHLVDGDALAIAERARNGATLFSDRKTVALASLEKGHWCALTASGRRGVREYGMVITAFSDAVESAGGADGRLSLLYQDALSALAKAHIDRAEWSNASARYEELEHYIKELTRGVRNDEMLIGDARKAMAAYEERQSSQPEIAVLTPAEQQRVLDALRIDYRHLLERALAITEALSDLRVELIAATARKARELSRAIRYHELSSELSSIAWRWRGDVPEGMLSDLEAVTRTLEGWRKAENKVFTIEQFDLFEELHDQIRSGIWFRRFDTTLVVDPLRPADKHNISFDRGILRSILQGLVQNVADAAGRLTLPAFSIVLGADAQNGTAYLTCKDNVGDRDALFRAVTAINNAEPVQSARGETGGLGLTLIRAYIHEVANVSAPWEAYPLDGGWKVLRVPIARVRAKRDRAGG